MNGTRSSTPGTTGVATTTKKTGTGQGVLVTEGVLLLRFNYRYLAAEVARACKECFKCPHGVSGGTE